MIRPQAIAAQGSAWIKKAAAEIMHVDVAETANEYQNI